jgi:hypothetical protein
MKIPFFIFVYFVVLYASQDLTDDDLLYLKNESNCWKADSLLYESIHSLFYDKKFDSVSVLLDAIDHQCKPMRKSSDERCRYLFLILSNKFSDDSLKEPFFHSIEQDSMKFSIEPGGSIVSGDQYLHDLYTSYNSLLTKIADSLAHKLDNGSVEYMVSLYYSGKFNEFFYRIKNDSVFKNTKLKKLYDERIHQLKFDHYLHISLSLGLWIPLDNLSKFGVHPYFNMNFIGYRWWRIFADLDFEYRLFKSKELIEFRNENGDTLFTKGNSFGVGHGMIVIGLEVFRKGFHQIDISCGFGMDLFKATGNFISSDPKDIILGSPSISPAISYYYLCGRNRGIIIGPQLRFSFLSYEKDENTITNLSGNAISIRLVVGLNSHNISDPELRRMRGF